MPPAKVIFPPDVFIDDPSKRAIVPPAVVLLPDASLSDHKVTLPPLVVILLLAATVILPEAFIQISAPFAEEVRLSLTAIFPPNIDIGPAIAVGEPIVIACVLSE